MYIDFHTHRPVGVGVVTPRTYGIHPWDAEKAAVPPVDDAVWRMVEVIGECGLDRVRGASMEKQMAVFEQQIAIAARLDKPLVIHCVRAYDLLLSLRKRWPTGRWVVHGFQGGVALVQQLAERQIGVSVGARILRPDSGKLRSAVVALGSGGFLLETDDSGVAIEDIYAATAAVLGVSLRQLQDDIAERYSQLLAH